jgi:hypothetical protein
MSHTGTTTASFTITEARYVGAKIGADLRLLNGLYGAPTASSIDQFTEEAALLLRDSYLGTVSYGFRDPSTNTWTFRLRYTATAGGQLIDSRPGALPPAIVIANCIFFSYLTYSSKFHDLPAADRERVEASLPVRRGIGDDLAARSGTTTLGNTYSRNGVGVDRDVFTAFLDRPQRRET